MAARGGAAKKMKLTHNAPSPAATAHLGIALPPTTAAPSYASPAPAPNGGMTVPHWGANQHNIPIDPALQAASVPPAPSAPTTYPPGYSFPQHYQAQYPPYHLPHTVPPNPTHPHPPHASTPTTQAQTTSKSEIDTTDVATLNDALGSAGVDLRAEEEAMHRSNDYSATHYAYTREDRSRKQAFLDPRILGDTMRKLATSHNVKVTEESVNYLALALRTRLQTLLTSMIRASEHRTSAQFTRAPGIYENGTPMFSQVVRRDIGKQIAALEKVDKEEDARTRRERKERERALAQQQAMAYGGGDDMDVDGGKKKKKKEGPGVAAKNMSEDVRKKMSNLVATQAAGIGGSKYAWMTAGAVGAASTPAKPRPAPSPATTTTPTAAATTTANGATPAQGATGGWARPYVPVNKKEEEKVEEDDGKPVVSLRDALFVIERERGHGGGRGSARGWV